MTRRAIAHKDYDVRGGGEVLSEQLAEAFDCPLFVGNKEEENIPDGFEQPLEEIGLENWQKRLIRRGGLPRSIAYMVAWRQDTQCLIDYDTIIMSGNEPLWYRSPDDQTVVAYTHATPRFQTDLWHTMSYTGVMGRIAGMVKMCQSVIYRHNVCQPDRFVANSDLVARRMNKYWNIPTEDIHTVYPPVPTEEYSPDDAPTEDYYLYLGRLDGHKRAGDVVEAFDDLDAPLRIAGKGSEKERLERIADDNITFEGFVSEARKKELYSGAKALVYPCQNEDFGMVPIEAMAAGTPVIGVNEGFTQYQVQEGQNGLLWDRSPGNLVDTIRVFQTVGVEWDDDEIAAWADNNFGVDRFADRMQAVVELAEEETAVDPTWTAPDATPTLKADGGNGD